MISLIIIVWLISSYGTQLLYVKRLFISTGTVRGFLIIKESSSSNNALMGYNSIRNSNRITLRSFQNNWRRYLARNLISDESFLRNYNSTSQRAPPININSKIEDVMGLDKISSIGDLFSFLRPTRIAELSDVHISNPLSLFDSSRIVMDDRYSLQLPHHSQRPLEDAEEDHKNKREPLTVAYLQQEIGLSESVLMNVIIKYSWVMYLKVNTNLRCTFPSLPLSYE